jgi:RNA polymerase sigma factor (TIGR02999 family)
MSNDEQTSVTGLLQRWSQGDREAAAAVLPQIYDELHRIAAAHFRRERGDHTLQPTAIVHEAYLQLVNSGSWRWESRAGFMALATRLMRNILVNYARDRGRQKRGGDVRQVTLIEAAVASPKQGTEVLALHEALNALAEIDPDKAEIVELRFFGGLTVEEVAELRGVSPATIARQWRRAKAWLYDELMHKDPIA